MGAFHTVARVFQTTMAADGTDITLSKAVQISIDIEALVAASEDVWKLLNNALHHFRLTDNLLQIISTGQKESIESLKKQVSASQSLLFDLISRKVEELLGSVVFIDFEPTSMPSGPHDSIEVIINFLDVI